MSKLLWISLALVNVVMVTACAQQREDSVAYYLEHPKELSQEVTACQSANLIQQSAPHCRMVMEAARSLMELIEEHQQSPQAFGQRVLDAQMKYAQTGQGEQQVKALLAVIGLNSPE